MSGRNLQDYIEVKIDRRKLPKSPEHRAKIAAAHKAKVAAGEHHIFRNHGSGPNHPNWRGGIKPSYYQRIAFAAYGHACQRCGSRKYPRVHHKDRDRRNNDVGNLEVLCQSCHSKEHYDNGAVCPPGSAKERSRESA